MKKTMNASKAGAARRVQPKTKLPRVKSQQHVRPKPSPKRLSLELDRKSAYKLLPGVAPAPPQTQQITPTEMVSETQQNYNDPDHKAKMLNGYASIPRDQFEHIANGDHIRYEDITGEFRNGGYIWYSGVKNDRHFWIVGKTRQEPRDRDSVKHFPLYWDKIRQLWKRISVEADLLIQAVDARQMYINDILMFLRKKFGAEFDNFMNERETARFFKRRDAT